ncbi:MAG TPA: hypothetical protein VMV92_03405 [Streptosporangiaceae bacterium]|nr:hypothetical protein [Streptosporangiaceae bacterium]
MPRICQHKLVWKLASLAVGSTAVLATNSGVALAAYSPPPPSALVRGGYYCVVTSQTVRPAGELIRSLRLNGLVARLRIPRGTFDVPVQITITEPYGRSRDCQGGPGIADAGFDRYRAVGGIGILVQRGGSAYHGTFRKPLSLRLSSASISQSSRVVVWRRARFETAPDAVVRCGSATVRVRAGGDFALLTRATNLRRADTTMAFRQAAGATAIVAAAPGGDLRAVAFLLAPGAPLPGLGVLAPRWLPASGASPRG